MANPNYSSFLLTAQYGDGDDTGQNTNIYEAATDEMDQVEHKYIYGVPVGGMYVELAHYSEVRQVVAQVLSDTNPGVIFWVDSQTAALVPEYVEPEEHVSFCVPDCAAGIMLYALDADTDWHLAFAGVQDG